MKVSKITFQAIPICLLILISSSISNAQSTLEVSGFITENTTWTDDTMKVVGDITVADNITLTIASGKTVKFMDYYKFNVLGTLIAIGSDNDSILFTVADTAGYYTDSTQSGGWCGIIFNDAVHYGGGNGSMKDNDSSRMSHCIIEYVKGTKELGYNPTLSTGGLFIRTFSRLILEHSQVRYCKSISTGGGISLTENSNPVIRYNLFYDNEAKSGGGVYVSRSHPLFHHNTIRENSTGNYSHGYGGGLYVYDCSALIENNEIIYNTTMYYGGGVSFSTAEAILSNNIIHSNTALTGGGISALSDDRSRFINNQIYNNYAGDAGGIFCQSGSNRIISNLIFNNVSDDDGGAVSLYYSSSLLLNNTIVNNLANDGGGIFTNSSNPTLVNNILWGNEAGYKGPQVYITDNIINPTIRFNTIEGGLAGFGFNSGVSFMGVYEDNLESYPGFIQATAGTGLLTLPSTWNWQLSTYSPCINAGSHQYVDAYFPEKDLDDELRVLYGKVDMGGLEKRIDTVTVAGTISSDSLLIADTIKVTADLIVEDGVTLTIGAGCVVQFQGHYMLDVQGTIIACGTELYPITFTCNDTINFSDENLQEGGWQGIYFINGHEGSRGAMHDNDTSRIMYCNIEYVKTRMDKWRGPIFVNYFNNLILRNNHIRNNISYRGAGGIYANDSEIDFRDNIIEGNKTYHFSSAVGGAGMYINDCQGVVKGNQVINNYINSDGGGITAYSSKLRLEDNIISYNTAEEQSGGIILGYGEDTLVNNIISNNSSPQGRDIYLYFSTTYLIGNLICNNGSGIYAYNADVTLVNNTIVNNNSTGFYGQSSDFRMHNTIVYGNYNQIQISNQFHISTIHNCIIQSGLGGITGTGAEDTENIINLDPGFLDPTEGYGTGYDGLSADYSLYQVSPAINKGVIEYADLLPVSDINNMPRIHNNAIDIGAFENQDAGPVILKHPFGGKYCDGDTLVLYSSSRDTATFQWMKDGVELAGKTDPSLIINPVTIESEGNYYCRISNAYDSLETIPAYISVNEAPEIVSDPEQLWIEEGKNAEVSIFAIGKDLSYQWFKDGEALSGEILPEYRFVLSDSSEEGEFHCHVNNYCGTDTSEKANVFLAPKLCMVTVSSTTGHNLVVWEKKSKAPVLSYNIYRESEAAGIYDLLANIPYDDLSVYVDNTADPTVQAYLYKITAIDTAEIETDIDLCKPHKTIHLLVTTNPELKTTQLAWDRYYGFDYITYTIYRSNTGVNFDPVHSLSASLNSWTDPNPSTGEFFYRIAVEKPDPCYPEGGGLKAGTGPYQHALSNMDDNKLKAGENPPDSLYLDNLSIDENKLPGSMVGRLVTIDLDTMDFYTYHLVNGDGDTNNNSFSIIGDLLVSATTFDFETKSTYKIRVRTTDNAAYYLEKAFVITITDTQEGTGTSGSTPPDSITLDNNSISENNLFGDPVGKLLTADKDSFDIHSYQLISGTGDADNLLFMITGDVLRAGYSFDFEVKDQYTIRVRSTDLYGNQIEKVFTINITDLIETGGISGVDEDGLSVYPNPFSQSTTISFPNPSGSLYEMKLTDLSGKLCRIQLIKSDHFILKRENLRKGMYIIELEGEKAYRKKIVIE